MQNGALHGFVPLSNSTVFVGLRDLVSQCLREGLQHPQELRHLDAQDPARPHGLGPPGRPLVDAQGYLKDRVEMDAKHVHASPWYVMYP